jgi:hypothetical protein
MYILYGLPPKARLKIYLKLMQKSWNYRQN